VTGRMGRVLSKFAINLEVKAYTKHHTISDLPGKRFGKIIKYQQAVSRVNSSQDFLEAFEIYKIFQNLDNCPCTLCKHQKEQSRLSFVNICLKANTF